MSTNSDLDHMLVLISGLSMFLAMGDKTNPNLHTIFGKMIHKMSEWPGIYPMKNIIPEDTSPSIWRIIPRSTYQDVFKNGEVDPSFLPYIIILNLAREYDILPFYTHKKTMDGIANYYNRFFPDTSTEMLKDEFFYDFYSSRSVYFKNYPLMLKLDLSLK